MPVFGKICALRKLLVVRRLRQMDQSWPHPQDSYNSHGWQFR